MKVGAGAGTGVAGRTNGSTAGWRDGWDEFSGKRAATASRSWCKSSALGAEARMRTPLARHSATCCLSAATGSPSSSYSLVISSAGGLGGGRTVQGWGSAAGAAWLMVASSTTRSRCSTLLLSLAKLCDIATRHTLNGALFLWAHSLRPGLLCPSLPGSQGDLLLGGKNLPQMLTPQQHCAWRQLAHAFCTVLTVHQRTYKKKEKE